MIIISTTKVPSFLISPIPPPKSEVDTALESKIDTSTYTTDLNSLQNRLNTLEGLNISSRLNTLESNKLDLSGGTMTGAISFNPDFAIHKSSDDKELVLFGGNTTSDMSNPVIGLRGKNRSINPGTIYLRASTSNSDYTQIVINPDSSLNVDNTVACLQRVGFVGQNSYTTTNPWYKVCSVLCNFENWDPQITFLVEQTYGTHAFGILRIHLRTNSSKVLDPNVCTIKWLINSGFAVDQFVLVLPTEASSTAELWTNIPYAWVGRRFSVLSEGNRTDAYKKIWQLYETRSPGQAASITTSGTQIVSS